MQWVGNSKVRGQQMEVAKGVNKNCPTPSLPLLSRHSQRKVF